MQHFKAINQQDVTTINDTDCCLYLKYKVPLKTFQIYKGEVGLLSGKFLDGVFAYQHIPVFGNSEKWEYVCYFYLPVKNRDDDEVYAYALESNATMRKIRIAETRHSDSQNQITSYMHLMFTKQFCTYILIKYRLTLIMVWKYIMVTANVFLIAIN